jgi:hypothetical protein
MIHTMKCIYPHVYFMSFECTSGENLDVHASVVLNPDIVIKSAYRAGITCGQGHTWCHKTLIMHAICASHLVLVEQ